MVIHVSWQLHWLSCILSWGGVLVGGNWSSAGQCQDERLGMTEPLFLTLIRSVTSFLGQDGLKHGTGTFIWVDGSVWHWGTRKGERKDCISAQCRVLSTFIPLSSPLNCEVVSDLPALSVRVSRIAFVLVFAQYQQLFKTCCLCLYCLYILQKLIFLCLGPISSYVFICASKDAYWESERSSDSFFGKDIP